jgi:hypothetical protein
MMSILNTDIQRDFTLKVLLNKSLIPAPISLMTKVSKPFLAMMSKLKLQILSHFMLTKPLELLLSVTKTLKKEMEEPITKIRKRVKKFMTLKKLETLLLP